MTRGFLRMVIVMDDHVPTKCQYRGMDGQLKFSIGILTQPGVEVQEPFSPNDIIACYTKWRESTSTSPYGDHLGHDKAVLRHTSRLLPTDDPSLHIGQRMFAIKALLLNLANGSTFLYERWLTVINAMIEKIPGNPCIDKMRIIHIISADSNYYFGELFYRLLQQAEQLQQFGEEQSGSRKKKDCQDVQLLKHLVYSIVRLTRANGSTFDNDAKSCYDRIVMLFPSLLAQRLGMPSRACNLLLLTLANIKYHTKTAFGISSMTYTTTPHRTVHGPGQGSKSSPAI